MWENNIDLSETAEGKLWKGQFSPWTPTKFGTNRQNQQRTMQNKGDIDGVETALIICYIRTKHQTQQKQSNFLGCLLLLVLVFFTLQFNFWISMTEHPNLMLAQKSRKSSVPCFYYYYFFKLTHEEVNLIIYKMRFDCFIIIVFTNGVFEVWNENHPASIWQTYSALFKMYKWSMTQNNTKAALKMSNGMSAQAAFPFESNRIITKQILQWLLTWR